MRPWERRWFRYWSTRTPRERRPRQHPIDWLIAAPVKSLAWLMNAVQEKL